MVACNTVFGGSPESPGVKFPEVPFVGMEPRSTASQQTPTGVGVLGTPDTCQGELYITLVVKFARNVAS